MRHVLTWCRLAIRMVFVACFLAACAWQGAPETSPAVSSATAAKPTALTADAATALRAAEQSIDDARAKGALWTSALRELELARAAAREFDSETTLAHAREAITLCGLSVQQLSAPPVKW